MLSQTYYGSKTGKSIFVNSNDSKPYNINILKLPSIHVVIRNGWTHLKRIEYKSKEKRWSIFDKLKGISNWTILNRQQKS